MPAAKRTKKTIQTQTKNKRIGFPFTDDRCVISGNTAQRPHKDSAAGAAECLRCQFAAECLRCQFAGVAALRSALHSNRTFVTRGRYFVDRHAGVLFPVALTPGAGNKVFLRVQSERSERLRE